MGENVFTLTTPEEISSYADGSGLIIERCEMVDRGDVTFDSRDEFQSWVQALGQPHGIKNVFGKREVEFVQDVVEAYCKEYNSATDGKVTYPFPKEVNFVASKKPIGNIKDEHKESM